MKINENFSTLITLIKIIYFIILQTPKKRENKTQKDLCTERGVSESERENETDEAWIMKTLITILPRRK
jgi:hypothetical protein